MTETQKSTVIEVEASSQRLSDTREDHPISRALVPLNSRPVREQWQTARRRQSVRKALAAEHGQPQQTYFAKEVYHPPTPQPIDTHLLPDEKWLQQIRASRQKENNAVAVRATPLVERRPPDVGKVIPLVEDRQIQVREDFATRALHVCLERQPQRDAENTFIQQGANALHVARRKPGGEVWQPPVALALDRGASAQTKDRRDKKSHAEDRVLKAIRSKADSDGKNARVGYENLAAMAGFSRRHVIRVVKSLIYERGMLRVEKRVMKPGHNAINVYQVVSRDVTASEKGSGVKTGKAGQ